MGQAWRLAARPGVVLLVCVAAWLAAAGQALADTYTVTGTADAALSRFIHLVKIIIAGEPWLNDTAGIGGPPTDTQAVGQLGR